jgi:hypothetical protein
MNNNVMSNDEYVLIKRKTNKNKPPYFIVRGFFNAKN